MSKPKRHLLVVLGFTKGIPDWSELRAVLAAAPAWRQLSPSSYVIWTSLGPSTWTNRFVRAFGKDEDVFVVEFDPVKCQGNLSKSFWDWLENEPDEDDSE